MSSEGSAELPSGDIPKLNHSICTATGECLSIGAETQTNVVDISGESVFGSSGGDIPEVNRVKITLPKY